MFYKVSKSWPYNIIIRNCICRLKDSYFLERDEYQYLAVKYQKESKKLYKLPKRY
jgi:hypothetical protein